MRPEEIRAKLQTLDVKNDDLWTEDGVPVLAAIGQVTRAQVTAAAPTFSRKTPSTKPTSSTNNAEEDDHEDIVGEPHRAAGSFKKPELNSPEKPRHILETEASMAWCRAQQEERMQRYLNSQAAAKAVKDAGVTQTPVRSPLDQAMRRRTGYGHGRPTPFNPEGQAK